MAPPWLRELPYRVGLFLLACLVGLGIMVLVTLPLVFIVWQVFLYAARQ